jgi:uncharacterized protein YihD (DUF1040 family)
MRDPARISRVLEALRVAWVKHPDMRLGQLLNNLTRANEQIFHVEDEVYEGRLKLLTMSGTWPSC